MTRSERLAAAHACVTAGAPPILLICASSGEELSACSREFVRGMRRDGVRDPGMGRKQRLAPGREQREGKQQRAPFARPQRAQEARRRCGPGNHGDVMYPARPQVNATGRWFWHKPARGAGAAPDIPQRSTDT